MNPVDATFVIVNTVATSITCWYAMCGLNACTRKTPMFTRYSFAAIAIGAFAVLLHPPEMDIGGFGTLLTFVGVAVGFLANRRQCVCLNCPSRGGKRTPAPLDRRDGLAV